MSNNYVGESLRYKPDEDTNKDSRGSGAKPDHTQGKGKMYGKGKNGGDISSTEGYPSDPMKDKVPTELGTNNSKKDGTKWPKGKQGWAL